ncbi:MAG: hypothetical protein EPN17_10405 [Methylobacter sp.]|nr:MAG: hypothetical protein EPN17_10405 [Methylobacter sp.]
MQIFEIKKADIAKIKKLEEALDKLKSGEERYYVITKLSSIKSLCKNETLRRHYCWYLFDCVKRQLETKVTEVHQQTPKEQFIFNLVHEIAQVMVDMQEGKDVSNALHKHRNQLAHYQSDYKKIKWTTVRLIKSTDLLIIEYFIDCLLSTDDSAQKLAYHATRSYVERYDPSVGTGLITKSIPMFEDVAVFWRQVAFNNSYRVQ